MSFITERRIHIRGEFQEGQELPDVPEKGKWVQIVCHPIFEAHWVSEWFDIPPEDPDGCDQFWERVRQLEDLPWVVDVYVQWGQSGPIPPWAPLSDDPMPVQEYPALSPQTQEFLGVQLRPNALGTLSWRRSWGR